MNQLSPFLQKIGLSDKEATIYLSLSKFDQASVAEIADDSKIKRPNTYLILEEMRKKGLVKKVLSSKKEIYVAVEPETLKTKTADALKELRNALPKLLSLQPSEEIIRVLQFEGGEGFHKALLYRIDELKNTSIVGFWAKDTGLPQETMDKLNNWSQKMQDLNIIVTGITPDHPTLQKYREVNPEFYKNIIFIPQGEYSSEISIEVTNLFVRIVDPYSLQAIIIEDRKIMHAFRQIFQLVMKQYE